MSRALHKFSDFAAKAANYFKASDQVGGIELKNEINVFLVGYS